jgi:hypothetical protein
VIPPCPDCGAEFVDAQLRHADTCPAGNSLDAVTDDDRQYFEDHPHELLRVRPITHAERLEWAHVEGVHVDRDARICVHNLAPGVRRRSLLPRSGRREHRR